MCSLWQFEQLISAARRLQLVVPLALLLVFLLLYATMGTVKDALLVFTGVPMALTAREMTLSNAEARSIEAISPLTSHLLASAVTPPGAISVRLPSHVPA